MKVTPLTTSSDETLYQQVAERIRLLILEGTLQPGDRLPSVRKLHKQLSVSISTVQEAYRLLEDQGVVSARPQSGYYVKHVKLNPPQAQVNSDPPWQICPVDTSINFQVQTAIRDPRIIKLGAAIPSPQLFPQAALNRLIGQVVRTCSEAVHAYDVPPGCAALRREVAKRLIDAGCSIAPDQIVTTNGAREAVYLSLKAVTQPGDTVAIESPCSYGFLEVLDMLHLKALELPTHSQEGISLKHLEEALLQEKVAACALVTNFSNPLGSCMSDAKKKKLVDILNHYDLPLVEDDVDGELNFEGARPKAVKAFDMQGRVLYCSSISKTLSSGLRVGWAVAGRYQQRIEQLKIAINETTAPALQLAVAAFFANGGYDRHLRQLRRAYQSHVHRMLQAIQDYFPLETRVICPKGGYVLWLELPPHFNAMQLYEEALQHHISIAPGNLFSASGSYRNCFRLNCGLPWTEELDQAMQTLGHLTKKQLAVKLLGLD